MCDVKCGEEQEEVCVISSSWSRHIGMTRMQMLTVSVLLGDDDKEEPNKQKASHQSLSHHHDTGRRKPFAVHTNDVAIVVVCFCDDCSSSLT